MEPFPSADPIRFFRGLDDNIPHPWNLKVKEFSSSRRSIPYPEPPLSEELAVDFPPGTRWALVLSHDLDHISLREHYSDGSIFRHAYGFGRQHLLHRFQPVQLLDTWVGIGLASAGRDRWTAAVSSLQEAERAAGVRSTWFVAVRKGRGISYGEQALKSVLEKLIPGGFEIGLHGQACDNAQALAEECRDLSRLAGIPILGLRMHYLNLTPAVFDGAASAGLTYESTVFSRDNLHPDRHELAQPRLVRPGLVEIPLHVMDSTLFSSTGLGMTACQATQYCQRLMDRAAEQGKVLVMNLHPNMFSRQHRAAQEWYRGLLSRLTQRSDVWVTPFSGLLPHLQQPR